MSKTNIACYRKSGPSYRCYNGRLLEQSGGLSTELFHWNLKPGTIDSLSSQVQRLIECGAFPGLPPRHGGHRCGRDVGHPVFGFSDVGRQAPGILPHILSTTGLPNGIGNHAWETEPKVRTRRARCIAGYSELFNYRATPESFSRVLRDALLLKAPTLRIPRR